jgi:peptidoglycan/LPS O-acetylase OafA/YrhL
LGPFPSFPHIALSFFALDGALIPPRWTIAIEALGSALLPFMVIVAVKSRRAYYGLILLLLAFAYFLADAPHHINALSYMFDFALGALVVVQPRIFRFVNAPILVAGATTLVFFRVVWFAALNGRLMPLEHGYFDAVPAMVEAVAATILIAGIVNKAQGSQILRTRSLVWLGDISYSLYLVHFPIMLFLVRIMNGAVSGMPLWFAATATIVAGLLVSLVAAAVSYRFVERPANAPGRKIGDEVAAWVQSKRRAPLRAS